MPAWISMPQTGYSFSNGSTGHHRSAFAKVLGYVFSGSNNQTPVVLTTDSTIIGELSGLFGAAFGTGENIIGAFESCWRAVERRHRSDVNATHFGGPAHRGLNRTEMRWVLTSPFSS